ncbi:glycine betaine ABC transporter substrate-binding protein [Rhodococcus spongiicola]|uniref:Glycine betaine ABC transporter substrate-binding protein n=1 Tax=Rhodococcus spongiicola TaxID=2487352 RepID=A0A438B665_9NOCA|nr:glycine betaine ABC transporter substrate-binding protein [Rhodococcus spongiicola]RVW06448.1 glycine betaine ABC transporter substrate-binding protein [Rhodococcus spongiicola]
MFTKALSAGAVVLSLTLSGCALTANSPAEVYGTGGGGGVLDGAKVTVASKAFTEQLILCEITAQRLESQGANVNRVCGMTGSNTVRAAEVSGNVDMSWEYTGTGWLTHLGEREVITDPEEQYTKVRDEDLERNQIVWLPPMPANNTYAVAVKTETAARLGLETLSDYANLAKSDPNAARFCGASEFLGRDDGWPGLQQAYGFSLPRNDIAELADGAIYNAVATNNPCTFGEVFATDGRIPALGLTILTDDLHFFPVYNGSLTVRESTLDEYPQIAPVMAPVSALLDDETMRQLNASVDADGRTPEEVAGTWLHEHGLA